MPDPRDRGAVPGLRFAILSQRWIILMLPRESQIASLAPETHRRPTGDWHESQIAGLAPETHRRPKQNRRKRGRR